MHGTIAVGLRVLQCAVCVARGRRLTGLLRRRSGRSGRGRDSRREAPQQTETVSKDGWTAEALDGDVAVGLAILLGWVLNECFWPAVG